MKHQNQLKTTRVTTLAAYDQIDGPPLQGTDAPQVQVRYVPANESNRVPSNPTGAFNAANYLRSISPSPAAGPTTLRLETKPTQVAQRKTDIENGIFKLLS